MAFITLNDIDRGSCLVNVDNIEYICSGSVVRNGVEISCTHVFCNSDGSVNCSESLGACKNLIQSCGVNVVSEPNPTPTPTPTAFSD